MPRASRAQTEANRAAVVRAAAALVRERGAAGLTLDAVAARAGLTHGGFYKQFASKDALIAEAVDEAARERREATAAVSAREGGRAALLDWYLSAAHRDAPASGCVVAGLAGEASVDPHGALGDGFRGALDDLIAARASGTADREAALADVALMVGAIELARATAGTPLSDELLAAARARLAL
ncbi:TetR/AcrR family transcriptional regulator [Gryllotalpicola protaetiae]|uniref:TetR/AcrR family transcriptional regulator n=1 Tax=Gryllotalpicola protaetiae TaxID=2419771 RepID=A0A387BQS3_9MICO|nr:TetR/AcrR family transcriptional regulator [Gryllotalpicola protaetiae]AYG03326.1 TetR/AcrR family transcriptional regulator [Gryllotalpicola protaetiae]